MAKLTLIDLANLSNEQTAVTNINTNSARIEAAMEDTLSRVGTPPNEMESTLDMNSNHIINLPEAASATEPVRKREHDLDLLSMVIGEFPPGALDAALTNKIATEAEAVEGSNNLKLMTPLRVTNEMRSWMVDTHREFGTVGDGVAVDHVKIQQALDFAKANRLTVVYVPPGYYRCEASLTVPAGVTLRGGGMGLYNTVSEEETPGTFLEFYGNGIRGIITEADGSSIDEDPDDAPAGCYCLGVERLSLRRRGGTMAGSRGMMLNNARGSRFRDVFIEGFQVGVELTNYAIDNYFEAIRVASSFQHAYLIRCNPRSVMFVDCYGCTTGTNSKTWYFEAIPNGAVNDICLISPSSEIAAVADPVSGTMIPAVSCDCYAFHGVGAAVSCVGVYFPRTDGEQSGSDGVIYRQTGTATRIVVRDGLVTGVGFPVIMSRTAPEHLSITESIATGVPDGIIASEYYDIYDHDGAGTRVHRTRLKDVYGEGYLSFLAGTSTTAYRAIKVGGLNVTSTGSTKVNANATNSYIVTMHANAGTLTVAGADSTSPLTTPAGSAQDVVVYNGNVGPDSVITLSRGGTCDTGTPDIRVLPGAGSFLVKIFNRHASAAFNGTFALSYLVVNT